MGTAKERGVEMRSTENYELNLLDAEDFVNREVLNENTEKIDEVLKTLEEPEHDTTKQTEVEELESGESLKVALRKLAKAVADYISHKADKVAHITAEERTAWNAKLGAEKIAANLTTTEAGMLLDATMGKQLAETDASLQEQISTLNSNLSTSDGKLKIYSGVLYLDGGASGNVYHYYKENGAEWYVTPKCMIECVDENSSYNVAITNGTKTYHTIKNNETVTLGIRWTVIGLIKE